jgi:heme/copper-type cytochrome/quinol oxidase subunit 4
MTVAAAAAVKFFRILRRCTANHGGFDVYWCVVTVIIVVVVVTAHYWTSLKERRSNVRVKTRNERKECAEHEEAE